MVMPIEDRQAQEIGRAFQRSMAGQEIGAAERGEIPCDQAMGSEPRPGAEPAADADIEILPGEVDIPARDIQPHGDIGMGHLEGAEPWHQPIGGEGMDGGDGEHALRRFAQGAEGGFQALEGVADLGRQALADLRQHHPARLAQEQGRPDPVLQQLHLVADGGLGHAQFGRRLGEAPMACGRLEGADGAQGRQPRHPFGHGHHP